MFRYTVDVGFTSSRPIVVDEHVSRVVLLAEDDTDAVMTAASMVMRGKAQHLGLRDDVQMPTSTRIVCVEL